MDDSLGMPSIYSLTRVLGPGRHSVFTSIENADKVKVFKLNMALDVPPFQVQDLISGISDGHPCVF